MTGSRQRRWLLPLLVSAILLRGAASAWGAVCQFNMQFSSGIMSGASLQQSSAAAVIQMVAWAGPSPCSGSHASTWSAVAVSNPGVLPDQYLIVGLFKDTNGNGIFDINPVSSDTQIGSWQQFVNSKATITFPAEIFAAPASGGGPATYYLAVEVSSLPYQAGAIPVSSVAITADNLNFTFATLPPGGALNPMPYGTGPYGSGPIQPVDVQDFLVFSGTASWLYGAYTADTSSGMVLATLQMATTGDWAFVSSITLNASVSAPWSPNWDDVVGFVQLALYQDTNGNGIFDAGDTNITLNQSSVPIYGVTTLSLNSPLAVSQSTVTVFLVADADPTYGQILTQSGPATFSFSLSTASFYLISPDTMSSISPAFMSPTFTLERDTTTPLALCTPNYPIGPLNTSQPSFVWQGPSSATAAGLGSGASFYFQLGTDPDFVVTVSSGYVSMSVSTTIPTTDGSFNTAQTLADATTYYWHVRAYNSVLKNYAPWSPVVSFVTDLTPPAMTGAFLTKSSTGGLMGEGQWNNLLSGVTAQVNVQDLGTGLAVSTGALAYAGDGRSHPGVTSGYGVMYSTDAGQDWIDASSAALMINPYSGGNVYSLVVFKDKLYEGNYGNSVIYYSTDGFKTWGSTDTMAVSNRITAMTVFKGRLVAASSDGKMYFSDSSGLNWNPAKYTNGTKKNVSHVLTQFNGKLYAADDLNGTGLVWVSTGGDTWSPTNNAKTLPSSYQLWGLGSFHGKLYAGDASADLYVSTDGGSRWNMVGAVNQYSWFFETLTEYNGNFYGASTGYERLSVSNDGVSWNNTILTPNNNWTMASQTVFNGKFYAGTYGAIWVTPDGINWSIPSNMSRLLSPANLNYIDSLAAFNGKLYVGDDGGYIYQITPVPASLTGTDGTTAISTLSATSLNLVQSTNSQTCNGSFACGATNQVVFTVSDMAGNVRTLGPYAVLVHTPPHGLPAGCGAGLNVAQDGSGDDTSIQHAVNAMLAYSPVLSTNTCIVIRDTGTYREQVTIQGFSGSSLTIMSDPSFISSAPVVSPPKFSTAAFRIMNSFVNIQNVISSAAFPMNYGILVSSPSVTLSSITVLDLGGTNYALAGLALASNNAFVSSSTIAVSFDTCAVMISGSSNTVIGSSMTNNGYGPSFYGAVTSSATALAITGSYNSVSQSTVTGGNGNSPNPAYLSGGAAYAVSVSSGSGNIISNLVIIPGGGGGGGGGQTGGGFGPGATGGGGAPGYQAYGGSAYALYLNATSSNSLSGIMIRESGGTAASGAGASGGGGSGEYSRPGGSAYAVYLANASSNTLSGITVIQSGGTGGAAGGWAGGGGAAGGGGGSDNSAPSGDKGEAYVVYLRNASSNTLSGISITQSGGRGGDGVQDTTYGLSGAGGAGGGAGGSSAAGYAGGGAYEFYIFGSSYNQVYNSSIMVISGSTPGVAGLAGGARGSSATATIAILAGSVGNTFTNVSMNGANGVVIDAPSNSNTVRNSTIAARTDLAYASWAVTTGSVPFAGYFSSGSFNTAVNDSFSGYYGVYLASGTANTVSLSTITGSYYGLAIATPTSGFSISSLTFRSLLSGATAISFLGGPFVSTFTNVAFNEAGGTNIDASALGAGSTIFMLSPSGPLAAPFYADDPALYIDWPIPAAPVAPANNASGVSQSPSLAAVPLMAGGQVQYEYQLDALAAMNSNNGAPLYDFNQAGAQLFPSTGTFSGQDGTISAAGDSYLGASTATFVFYSSASLALNPNSTYYWRVRAKTSANGSYLGSWSSVQGFTTGQSASTSPINNLAISSVSILGALNSTATISFSIAENNVTNGATPNGGAYNTADWIFVKFSTQGGANGTWNHATLASGGGVGPGATLTVASDNMGAFLDHTASNALWTATVTLNVNTSALVGRSLMVQVYAVSMVHIPTGVFVYNAANEGGGAPNCGGTGPFYVYGAGTAYTPGNVPGWPNGYNSFYMMRYAVTQGQYADFLNSVSVSTAAVLYPGDNQGYGSRMTHTGVCGGILPCAYSAADRNAAANSMATSDLWSFLSWAALRPPTEMEFEKAGRDVSPGAPGTVDARDYPWSSVTPTTPPTYSPPNEGRGAAFSKYYMNFNSLASASVLDVGRYMSGDVYRTPAQTGASPYGIADLAGSVWTHVLNCVDLSVPSNGTGTVYWPSNWPGAASALKGLRGGGWSYAASPERVSDRSNASWTSTTRNGNVGGRGARAP